MAAFHHDVDSVVPSLTQDLVDAWGRQRLRYTTHGKLTVLDFNPQVKLSRLAKRSIRRAINWKADEESDKWVKQHSFELVRHLDETSRQALRVLLKQVKIGQATVSQIGSIVGLTDRNATTIAEMIKSGKTTVEIEAHTKKLLLSRGRQIAHNEAIAAANMGLQLAYQKGLDTGLLKSASRKVWQTEADSRVCPICTPMRRKQSKIDGKFSNGLLTPPSHPGCRCWMTLNIAS